MKAKQANVVKRPVKAPAARRKTAPVDPKKGATLDSAGKKFLQSSLGAITRSRDDATEAVAEGLGRFAESIGLRKLEDVFDQRVASALARIGIPTAKELARLKKQVEQLSRQIDELKSRQRK